MQYTIILVDDGSSDNTSEQVRKLYPDVILVYGSGNLFWAGGMRLAWLTAMKNDNYDAYILLNDDVEVKKDIFEILYESHCYSLQQYGVAGIYSASTYDKKNKSISYGGRVVMNYILLFKSKKVEPNGVPQLIDLANGNILWIDNSVLKKIGILSHKYTHGIADYDYSLTCRKNNIPVLLASTTGGYCEHKNNTSMINKNISVRIRYLKAPNGLAFNEYLWFVWKHFPFAVPYSIFVLLLRTLFPRLWNFKNK